MPITSQKINPCLWFDTEAEDAARFYCSVFKNSKMGKVSRYVDEGQEIHGKPAGSVQAFHTRSSGAENVRLMTNSNGAVLELTLLSLTRDLRQTRASARRCRISSCARMRW